MANRFTTLAVEHGLIDPGQYCFAGRSTQDALVYNLDFIYEGWLQKKKVSQLFLDMTGAYDRVIRQKLIEILARKRLPDRLVDFLRSYLSGRRTNISIPGYVSATEVHLNIGIA